MRFWFSLQMCHLGCEHERDAILFRFMNINRLTVPLNRWDMALGILILEEDPHIPQFLSTECGL